MNDLDRVIAMLKDDIAMGRATLTKLTRLAELLEERGQVFREEMSILRRFEAQPGPMPKPPMLNPLGVSEFVDGAWIVDEESWSRRPR
jgi:hypothetical protein